MTYKIKSTVIRNPAGKVKYKLAANEQTRLYHIGTWLDATEDELNEVMEVKYRLHETFSRRDRSSRNRANDFSITYWAWGAFDIEVELVLRDGTKKSFAQKLEIELPYQDAEYEQVS